MIPPRPDLRAVRILNRTYWSAEGWLRSPAVPDPDDFLAAQAAGVMFQTKRLDHAAAIEWARRGAKNVDRELVSDAFLASLTSKRPDLRSALASHQLGRALPEHRYQHTPSGCLICGLDDDERDYDLNVLNFERLKWGGVRFTSPVYIGFDLSQAATWKSIEPLSGDLDLMRALLKTIRDLGASNPEARPQHLEKAIAPVISEGHYQRRVVLEVLAFCAVLQPTGRPSFARGWIKYFDRPEAPEHKNDWKYPMHAWRGLDGVDGARLAQLFPRLATG